MKQFDLTGNDVEIKLELENRCIHVLGIDGKELPRTLIEPLVWQAFRRVFPHGIVAKEIEYYIDAEKGSVQPR